MGSIAAALTALFQRLGGSVRLHDPVLHVHAIGNRVSEVETASGWHERFDAVASNADLVHTYRDLVTDSPRGREEARRLSRKRFAPGLFTVHFGLEGSWPGIPHNTVLMGPRFKGLIEDVFTHGVLPQDQLIVLSHPSVTDPSVAPPGKSTFSATIPVAHQGKLPIDWETLGELVEKRVLAEIGRRLIPDLDDRIVTRFHISPRDGALEYNAWMGGAFSLEPVFSQSGPLRARSRDAKLQNLYLVGAATAQGAGTSGVIASARATARLMLESLR
jgi:phytoene desaturase